MHDLFFCCFNKNKLEHQVLSGLRGLPSHLVLGKQAVAHTSLASTCSSGLAPSTVQVCREISHLRLSHPAWPIGHACVLSLTGAQPQSRSNCSAAQRTSARTIYPASSKHMLKPFNRVVRSGRSRPRPLDCKLLNGACRPCSSCAFTWCSRPARRRQSLARGPERGRPRTCSRWRRVRT